MWADLTFAIRIDNLFNNDYLTSGYGGNYAYVDNDATIVGGWAEYYVAAERSFFSELKLEMF